MLKGYFNYLLWFIAAFTMLIGFEAALASLLTGYTLNNFSFLLWEKFHFFVTYFLEEPIETLSFILIDKPLFKIESLQKKSNLSYLGITLLWRNTTYTYSHSHTS